MEINKETLLKDIISKYPQVKERIEEINPKFKMLNSPVGKIMLDKVTLDDISKKSGMDVNEVIRMIKKII